MAKSSKVDPHQNQNLTKRSGGSFRAFVAVLFAFLVPSGLVGMVIELRSVKQTVEVMQTATQLASELKALKTNLVPKAEQKPTLVLFQEVYVKGGAFRMGSDDGHKDEFPVHKVTVSDFSMATTETTQSLYQSVMGKNPSLFLESDGPVDSVSWLDALRFCNALSDLRGLQKVYQVSSQDVVSRDPTANGYRLPTEAEWEWAASGGVVGKGDLYAGSNDPDAVGWYQGNAEGVTHPVGKKEPNELGIYDMSGNVWEWCWDWYGPYSASAAINPTGPSTGVYRVGRGGTWAVGEFATRVTNRVPLGTPGYLNSVTGIRLVRSTTGAQGHQ